MHELVVQIREGPTMLNLPLEHSMRGLFGSDKCMR